MIKKLFLLLLIVSTTSIFIIAQSEATPKNSLWISTNKDSLPTKIAQLEIPKLQEKETVISHTGYSLSYNETYEQANWVAYELTKEETNHRWKRTNKFLIDPKVETETANDKDYYRSGYDRGHLAPAGDMGWSIAAMAESFYYSNMSPQVPAFNRGIWKQLEELVRVWAVENEAIYIVTAPVLTAGLPTIGENQVTVPHFYYKVILDYTAPNIKGIGFIFPNASSSEELQAYAVSIDSVEALTGIDFFSLLPDDQENNIESNFDLNSWSWKNSKSTKEVQKGMTPIRCNGITKAGKRCNNKTTNVSGYCYQHKNKVQLNFE